jgi:hypothetical protein
LFRTAVLLPAALAIGVCSGVSAGDLVDHNGFEACWSKAITQAQFTGLMQSAIDGATACLQQSSGPCGTGCSYTICNAQDCPGNTVGCPVTIHADPFGGTFAAGTSSFTASGSASDVSVPVSYTLFSANAACTITASSIGLSYLLDYTLTVDGNNGLYAASLDQSPVTVDPGYVLSSPDLFCEGLAGLLAPTLITQVETAAAAYVMSLEAPATVSESVCPLTP